jgi:hypothetical protein
MSEFTSRDAVMEYLDHFSIEAGQNVDRKTIVNWCTSEFSDMGFQRTTFEARIQIMTIGCQKWSDESHLDGHDDVFIVENGALVRFDPKKHIIPE